MQKELDFSTNRNIKLDSIKWCLTLLIVMYHIPINGARHLTAVTHFSNIAEGVVDVFSIISGFLFFYKVDTFVMVTKK